MSSVPQSSIPNPQSPTVPQAAQWLPGLFDPAAVELLPWVRDFYVPWKLALGGKLKTGRTTLIDVRMFDKFCRETMGRAAVSTDVSVGTLDRFSIWHRGRKNVHSGATINRPRATLSAIWKVLADHDPPLAPPWCRLRKAKVAKRLPRAWSIDEINKIMFYARDHASWPWYRPRGRNARKDWTPPAISSGLWFFAVLYTAYYTGLRINALLTMPTAGLDLVRQTIWIPHEVQKHGAEQEFQLPKDGCDAWRKLDPHGRGLAHLGDDWPYDRGPNGNWQTLGKWHKRLLRESGVVPEDHQDYRYDGWHKLRKTFATQVAARKGIEEAREQLGHSSVAVTARYIDQRFMPRTNVVDILPRPTPPPADILPLRIHEGGG